MGEVGALIELYGSAKRLSTRVKQILAVTRQQQLEPRAEQGTGAQTGRPFEEFFQELKAFDLALSTLGFMTIDVYYPGLSADILSVIGSDIAFGQYYNSKVVPKYGLNKMAVPLTFLELVDTISGDFGYQPVLADKAAHEVSRDEPGGEEVLDVTELGRLYTGLERCRNLIGDIVRQNWSFRDVMEKRARTVSVTVEGGITNVKNEFNIDRSQIGAVGPSAYVHDLHLEQNTAPTLSTGDLHALAEQLSNLREELSKRACGSDHDSAILAVTEAESAANKGDISSVMGHLAKAGNWAFDVATKIGVSVAAEAIKTAIGLR
jgi:hypothetical protein